MCVTTVVWVITLHMPTCAAQKHTVGGSHAHTTPLLEADHRVTTHGGDVGWHSFEPRHGTPQHTNASVCRHRDTGTGSHPHSSSSISSSCNRQHTAHDTPQLTTATTIYRSPHAGNSRCNTPEAHAIAMLDVPCVALVATTRVCTSSATMSHAIGQHATMAVCPVHGTQQCIRCVVWFQHTTTRPGYNRAQSTSCCTPTHTRCDATLSVLMQGIQHVCIVATQQVGVALRASTSRV